MHCINLPSNDPFFNLAAEEYLLKNSDQEYLLLYIDSPAVIIGKHQVAHREADTKHIAENNIPVIRRISGGGTVFHDEGNLNFAFISKSVQGRQVDFRKYTMPVIEFLSTLGVRAIFEGKNDLKVNGFKISGNAEHVYRERVLHHGTLLFNTRLNALSGSLRKDQSCYSTRAVSSNPSAVRNINEVIQGMDINDFRNRMSVFFVKKPGNSWSDLSRDEISGAGTLAESKFRTWEWNYAYGPAYKFKARVEINNRHYTANLDVKEGIIQDCTFQSSGEMILSGKKLIGTRHMPEDLREVFIKENIIISSSEIFKFF